MVAHSTWFARFIKRGHIRQNESNAVSIRSLNKILILKLLLFNFLLSNETWNNKNMEWQWLSGKADVSEPGGPGFDSSSRQPQVVAHQFNSIQLKIIYCTKTQMLNIQPKLQFRITIIININTSAIRGLININPSAIRGILKKKRNSFLSALWCTLNLPHSLTLLISPHHMFC